MLAVRTGSDKAWSSYLLDITRNQNSLKNKKIGNLRPIDISSSFQDPIVSEAKERLLGKPEVQNISEPQEKQLLKVNQYVYANLGHEKFEKSSDYQKAKIRFQ